MLYASAEGREDCRVRSGSNGLATRDVEAITGPVTAFRRGGALETVVGVFPTSSYAAEPSTGIFLAEQSLEPLAEGRRFFESNETRLSPAFIRGHPERFDVSRFKAEMGAFINLKMLEFVRRGKSEVSSQKRG